MKSLFKYHNPCCVAAALLATSFALQVSADCVTAPSGLVGFWPADGDYLDYAGTNNGTPLGNVTFISGVVGQAFSFDGSGDGVSLGNPSALRLQTFTIEAWIKRSSAVFTSFDNQPYANIFSWGGGGYSLGLQSDGRLYLSQVEVGSVGMPYLVTDTTWHQVAVTKSGSVVNFYVDGVAYRAPAYDPGFTFATSLVIGAEGGPLAACFYGAIDEVAVYNRALTTTEIQSIYNAGAAGKCKGPVVTGQPQSQVGFWGKSVTFTVGVTGSAPFQYAWEKDGVAISGATNSTLTLTNLQMTNGGSFRVVVSNGLGSTTSQPAILTMNPAGVSLGLYAGVTIDGVLGQTYGIQSTTDLSNPNSWLGVANVVLGAPTQLWFDVQHPTQLNRFYRVVPGPISIP